MYRLIKKSKKSGARLGVLTTAHGRIQTPFFMPIASKAAIKSLTVDEVKNLGAEIILSNTYHNYLRPGLTAIKKAGGLHGFMDCSLPILTDSGGYQVFSLSKLRQIRGNDITFTSYLDGAKHVLHPKKVIDIQVALGSDIMMVLDECVGLPSTREKIKLALERTTHWAKIALDYKKELDKKSKQIKKQLIFGIVQGGDQQDLRRRSVEELIEIGRRFSAKGGPASGWDGYAVGGLAVGESMETMYKVLDFTVPLLPEDKPRYLMGVGYPENIIAAVKRGVDMFDCVIPTREARHGKLYLWSGKPDIKKKKFYRSINITNAKFAKDFSPINNTTLKNYSKAYLHHLFKSQEPLALRLATLNNLSFYLDLMEEIRRAIRLGKL